MYMHIAVDGGEALRTSVADEQNLPQKGGCDIDLARSIHIPSEWDICFFVQQFPRALTFFLPNINLLVTVCRREQLIHARFDIFPGRFLAAIAILRGEHCAHPKRNCSQRAQRGGCDYM